MSREVPLTQEQFAIVDDEDFEKVSAYKWRFQTVPNRRTIGYARSHRKVKGGYTGIMMHRFILDAPNGMQVDHINGNGLDNRKCNLRLATFQQQQQNRALGKNNRSGYKGVGWWPRQKKWHACIQHEGRIIHLGYHDTPEAAAQAYDEAARRYFGEFAYTNFGGVK